MMCRFILVKTSTPRKPSELLCSFARMSEHCPAPDGDWQGDGWGVSWWKRGSWGTYTSLKPVWEDTEQFDQIPETTIFLAHARSASFATQKGILDYNQPYRSKNRAFVFNGLLKGTALPIQLEGAIGAQKIWSLLQLQLRSKKPKDALENATQLLNQYTKTVQGLNLGLSDGKNLYAYTQYAHNPAYYNLAIHQSAGLTIICSQALPPLEFSLIPNCKVVFS